jgi:D-alanyl-D-alanine carboxypeptidase/D-alanyl-D-alanine-endopeptidase (penicillin-binding protein 4)
LSANNQIQNEKLKMKKTHLLFAFYILHFTLSAQTTPRKLQKAYQQFESDSQLKHALISFYVINAKTGEVVFDKNSKIGLAPASTQKIIIAATAFELLGKGYRYKTELGYDGKIEDGILKGNLFVKGFGDPTFGSPRWKVTARSFVINKIIKATIASGIHQVDGNVYLDESAFSIQPLPDGWIWQDIGNYYGAGCWGINWNENQYDLLLKAGRKIGDSTTLVGSEPAIQVYSLINQIKTAGKESGDNAYIYIAPYAVSGFTQGTIPLGEDNFKISGSIPYPALQISSEMEKAFDSNHISIKESFKVYLEKIANHRSWPSLQTNVYTHYSPSLDSIIYWFLQKSINLYGEALIKTLAYEKKGFGATDSGVVIVKDFWKQKGVDQNELNIYDGSGLSPLNRVTTHAQVEILKYAKQQSWFPYFFKALPEYNNMKIKSGSISDVKGYCGYHTSGDGTQYIFSFLVNNYSGSSSALVSKMYKVLDVLK